MDLIKATVRMGIVICITLFYGIIIFGQPNWMIMVLRALSVCCVAVLSFIAVFFKSSKRTKSM